MPIAFPTLADFSPADIAALGVHLTRAIAREQARIDAWKADCARYRGVRMAGFGPDAFSPMTLAELFAEASAAKARTDAWRASPAGRFARAAADIAIATGDERLLACASRGLEGESRLAVELLASMEGPAADEARAALADLVGIQAERRAA